MGGWVGVGVSVVVWVGVRACVNSCVRVSACAAYNTAARV